MEKKDEGKKTILVVEDEPDILEILEFRLEKAGFTVLKAVDGPEGLRKAKNDKPDFMILDILIPGLDGNEVCRRIKSDEELKDIKIIMLSAKAEEFSKKEGLTAGADDYMTKPYDWEELIARINKISG